jgi:hypothetical protein
MYCFVVKRKKRKKLLPATTNYSHVKRVFCPAIGWYSDISENVVTGEHEGATPSNTNIKGV